MRATTHSSAHRARWSSSSVTTPTNNYRPSNDRLAGRRGAGQQCLGDAVCRLLMNDNDQSGRQDAARVCMATCDRDTMSCRQRAADVAANSANYIYEHSTASSTPTACSNDLYTACYTRMPPLEGAPTTLGTYCLLWP